jgi:hypothetical protein
MKPSTRRSWAVASLAAAVIVLILVIWLLPSFIVAHDVPASGQKASLTDVQRVAAIATSRQELLWAAGGLIAVITLAFTWQRDRVARERADLDRDANFTTRYTEAIKQLSDENLAVRLGGVYALERIAADSVRDRQTILDVLAAYLRAQPSMDPTEPIPLPPEDVAAAAVVLGRITQLSPPRHAIRLPALSLPLVDLRGANLNEAEFGRAFLEQANLSGANLRSASLVGANLGHADLAGAVMRSANLMKASLIRDLNRAFFTDADLSRASLRSVFARGARLQGATLTDADLTGADLRGAQLTGAVLFAANLTRADLTTANLIDADLTATNLTGVVYDHTTQWPAFFVPPQQPSR